MSYLFVSEMAAHSDKENNSKLPAQLINLRKCVEMMIEEWGMCLLFPDLSKSIWLVFFLYKCGFLQAPATQKRSSTMQVQCWKS